MFNYPAVVAGGGGYSSYEFVDFELDYICM
jgi:hypothetical protein